MFDPPDRGDRRHVSDTWYITQRGVRLDFRETPEELARSITIEDVAQGCSLTCRFGGLCDFFYPVAEHEVLVSRIVEELTQDPEAPKQGLLHDSPEGLGLGDVIRPLKRILRPVYWPLEVKYERAVSIALGVDITKPHAAVKVADHMALWIERRDVHTASWRRAQAGEQWIEDELLTREQIAWLEQFPWARAVGWSPQAARRRFLDRWVELGGKINEPIRPITGPISPREFYDRAVALAIEAGARPEDARERMAQLAHTFQFEIDLATDAQIIMRRQLERAIGDRDANHDRARAAEEDAATARAELAKQRERIRPLLEELGGVGMRASWEAATLLELGDRHALVRWGEGPRAVEASVPRRHVRAPRAARAPRARRALGPVFTRPVEHTQIVHRDVKPSKVIRPAPERVAQAVLRFGPWRSPAYLAWIRSLPCCVCGAPPQSEASHHGPRGVSQKATDLRAVPLCGDDHRHWHQHGTLPGRTRDQSERFLDARAFEAIEGFMHRHAPVPILVPTRPR